jgi:type I restriction enzyme S subunit
MLCDKLYRLKSSSRIESEFLAALIAVLGRREVEVEATGASSSMVNIAQAVILNLKIGLPPKEEQVEIVSAINVRTTRLDTLITKTELSLTLLKERRSALITAAVTGQIDLREAS